MNLRNPKRTTQLQDATIADTLEEDADATEDDMMTPNRMRVTRNLDQTKAAAARKNGDQLADTEADVITHREDTATDTDQAAVCHITDNGIILQDHGDINKTEPMRLRIFPNKLFPKASLLVSTILAPLNQIFQTNPRNLERKSL